MWRPRSVAAQVLACNLGILVVTVAAGAALYVTLTNQTLDGEYQQRALGVASAVAQMPDVAAAVETGDPEHSIQLVADRVRASTGASYVVVTDRQGVRFSHPNTALVGLPIEEPVAALDGHDHVGTDDGSLGRSANGRAPLRATDSRIVGQVSVGILEDQVASQVRHEALVILTYSLLALGLGVLASLVLARAIKRSTFGLEPRDIVGMVQEREAMLHGIREGVLGLDTRGKIIVVNDEAGRLLDLPDDPRGRWLTEVVPPGRLRDLLSGRIVGTDAAVLTDEHLLVVNRVPVSVSGRDTGSVVTLRDRTELEGLVRELHAVTGLTTALRAQEHEFTNRMHVMAGLLDVGERDEAARYLDEITHGSGDACNLRSRVAPPELAVLLGAKVTIAAEQDVDVRISPGSHLDQPVEAARILLTVMGNLVDNAVDAALTGPPPHRVDVDLSDDEGWVGIVVSDSGPGVPEEALEEIFVDGYSTKQPRGHAPWPRPSSGAPPRAPRGRHRHGHPGPRCTLRGPAAVGVRGACAAGRAAAVIRTLVVDDDYRVARIHAVAVSRVPGFSCVGEAHDAKQTHESIAQLAPDLLLLDVYLPDGDGLSILRTLNSATGAVPDCIVVTASQDLRTLRTAMHLGAVYYLVKPFRPAQLRAQLEAYRTWRARGRGNRPTDQAAVDRLYGLLRGPAETTDPGAALPPTMRKVFDAVRGAAAPVSATDVAGSLGVSRPTAQRYLNELERHRLVQLELTYGSAGRPVHRYVCTPTTGDERLIGTSNG